MAINPEIRYPGKTTPSTPEYPYGAARNITLPGDGTGTPWEAALVNDLFGWQQSILGAAAIIPSGNPDRVGSSQYLDALFKLVGRVAATMGDTVSLTGVNDGQRLLVTRYYSDTERGGGFFFWDSSRAKADHNGGTVLSPTVPWNGAKGVTHTAYLNGTGETDPSGTGCWVRTNYQVLSIDFFGATGEGGDDSTQVINSWIAEFMPGSIPGYVPGGVYTSSDRILFDISQNPDRRMPALLGDGPYSSSLVSTSAVSPAIHFFGTAAGPDHFQGRIERVGFSCDTANVAVAMGLDNLSDNLGNFSVVQCLFANPNTGDSASAVGLQLNWLFDCSFGNCVVVGKPNVGTALQCRQTHFCTFAGGSYSNSFYGVSFPGGANQCHSTRFIGSVDVENTTIGIHAEAGCIAEYISFDNLFIDIRDPVLDAEPVGGYMFDIQAANTGGFTFENVRPARLYSAVYGGSAFSPATNHVYVKLGGRYGGQTTPTLPASDVAETNETGQTQRIRIWGGTVSDIFINGNQLAGVTNGEFVLDPGDFIAVRYTVAPSWQWQAIS